MDNIQNSFSSMESLVCDLFGDLSSFNSNELLSFAWLKKLLDVFILCQDNFRLIIAEHKLEVCESPFKKSFSDYLGNCVKALDICNAIRQDGIAMIRHWVKESEFVVSILDCQRPQFKRASRALRKVVSDMHHDTDRIYYSNSSTWSASKTLHSIAIGLDRKLKGGSLLDHAIFTMNFLLFWVLWALVVAIPCQGRSGLILQFNIPIDFPWVISVHRQIIETTGIMDATGILNELRQMDKCIRNVNLLIDKLSDEQKGSIIQGVADLDLATKYLKNGLNNLELQGGDIYRQIMHFFTEGEALLLKKKPLNIPSTSSS